MNKEQYSKEFRRMSDEHSAKGHESYFSGADAPSGTIKGYYFSFGYFPADKAVEAMNELKSRIDADTSIKFDDEVLKFIQRQYASSAAQGNSARYDRGRMIQKLRGLIRDMKWITESGNVPLTPAMEIRQYAEMNGLEVAELSHSAWLHMPDGPEMGIAALYGIAFWDNGTKRRAYVLSWAGMLALVATS